MKRIKRFFYHLDAQLTLAIAGIFLLWFFTLISGLIYFQSVKSNQELMLERDRVETRLKREKPTILNEIILGHFKGLELILQSLQREEGLDWIRLEIALGRQTFIGGNNSKKTSTYSPRLKVKTLIDFDGKIYGVVEAGIIAPKKQGLSVLLLFLMAAFGLAITLIFIVIRRFVSLQVIEPIRRLISIFGDGQVLEGSCLFKSNSFEIEQLHSLFFQMLKATKQLEKQVLNQEKALVLGSLASQVAHDIRSPLAALGVLEGELPDLPEEKRLIARSAINRINDIANNLLERNQIIVKTPNVIIDKVSEFQVELETVQLISNIINQLISEKRLQFRSKIDIRIESRSDRDSYCLFAKIQLTEFKRIISNLINNSVEALGNSGLIIVSIASSKDSIQINICDNGKGIDEQILPKLMRRGGTYGKKGGSGFGLFHAETTVKKWHGSMRISSEVGIGTTVSILLPKASPPGWFVSELILEPNTKVVVLDDDPSIHQIWQSRLGSLEIEKNGIEIVHFSSPSEFDIWIKTLPNKNKLGLCLCDYEFLGEELNGLQLIERLGISSASILVTSRYEEPGIRRSCEQLRIKLIPKGMAGFVPISIKIKSHLIKPDAILLDDDELIHAVWSCIASKNKKNLVSFYEPRSFFNGLSQFDVSTPIYVDSDLGQNIKGEDLIEEIKQFKFDKIYLTTGYQREVCDPSSKASAVVGKDVPKELIN